jgi:4a-hydroxytetrahydrobiopterin dehydratase
MQDWQETKNGLVKVFQFKNFIDAINFVNEVAKIAESENHHPNILIHSYNQVKITTISHDEGQITCKDQSLVKLIDKIS